MKKKVLKVGLYLSALFTITSLVLFSCEKEDLMPVSAEEDQGQEAPIKDPENENDTLLISAQEFVFPFIKEVGQGVTYFVQPTFNNACGGFTFEVLHEVNLEVYDIQSDHIKFIITGAPSWLLDYRVTCVWDSTVYADGFLLGSSTN